MDSEVYRRNMMHKELIKNIDKIHTTPMGLERIKRNLNLPQINVMDWCKDAILHADSIKRNHKNYYVYLDRNVITVNATSYTIITAHKFKPKIQILKKEDYKYLEDFLYYAIFVSDGDIKPSRDIIYKPDVYSYIKDFGAFPTDLGVIAFQNGMPVGIAWTRIMHGYASIHEDTPELAISVEPYFRRLGVGSMLMNELFIVLKKQGYARTSLSVQKENKAVEFYQRLGYKIINSTENNSTYVMMKEL